MSLTKQQFLDNAALRFELVDVPGVGEIGVRSVPQLTVSRREVSVRDPVTGAYVPGEWEKVDVYALIDQIMVDENTPMFAEDDVEALGMLDAAKLAPFHQAVQLFNRQGGESDLKNG